MDYSHLIKYCVVGVGPEATSDIPVSTKNGSARVARAFTYLLHHLWRDYSHGETSLRKTLL